MKRARFPELRELLVALEALRTELPRHASLTGPWVTQRVPFQEAPSAR